MPRRFDDDDFEFSTDDHVPPRQSTRGGRKRLREPRNDADQAFKCGHCKQFIGAPVAGGRQRNHCPNCLYSRHVDHTRPGDRRSMCQSMMAPIGLVSRRNEDVIIHRCLGCGKEDPNRIAADDNPVALDALEWIEWSEFDPGRGEAFDKA
jgi:hypothetical protein